MPLPFTAAVQTRVHSGQMAMAQGRGLGQQEMDSPCPKRGASSEFQPLVALGEGRLCC